MSVADRLARLRHTLDPNGCDALVVTHLPNVRWLTGFTGSNARVVVHRDRAILLTDGRYTTQAGEQLAASGAEAAGVDLVITGAQSAGGLDELAAASAGATRIGLEANSVSWASAETLRAALPGDLVATTGVIERLRALKDAAERDIVRRAVELADNALAETLTEIGPGMTERDVAERLEAAMRTRGAAGTSFETIVAAGERAALPHARPGSRRLGRNELVVIDFGCRLDGYCSDCTRTVAFGEPEPELHELYAIVARAQDAARAVAAPGVACRDVDAAAREVIADAGYGEFFVHGTGHGVGLEIHELPRVGQTSDDILEAGMLITIEPGIYLPGRGGVRIEDLVAITDDGVDTFTTAPRVLVH